MENKPLQDAVESNTQHIVELHTTGRRVQKDIKELKGLLQLSSDVVKIKATMQQELTQLCSDMAHARGVIDALSNSTDSCMNNLEAIKSKTNTSNVKIYRKPPYYSHIFLSGDVKETNPFCFFIRNTFERLTKHFPNGKHRVLWIAGYFLLGRRTHGRLVPFL
jgi:hypothetical protein